MGPSRLPVPTWPDLSTLQALGCSALCSEGQCPGASQDVARAEPCAARSPRLGSLRPWAGGLPPPGHREPPLRVASPDAASHTRDPAPLCRQHPPSYGPGSTSSRVFSRALVLLLPARGRPGIWAALERGHQGHSRRDEPQTAPTPQAPAPRKARGAASGCRHIV